VLLINERPGAAYAARLGVEFVTVPGFIITLWLRGIISMRAARRKLDLIEHNTAPDIVAQARQMLNRLASAGGP
jgi:hypothetical protein